jgi:hypothetical protein
VNRKSILHHSELRDFEFASYYYFGVVDVYHLYLVLGTSQLVPFLISIIGWSSFQGVRNRQEPEDLLSWLTRCCHYCGDAMHALGSSFLALEKIAGGWCCKSGSTTYFLLFVRDPFIPAPLSQIFLISLSSYQIRSEISCEICGWWEDEEDWWKEQIFYI